MLKILMFCACLILPSTFYPLLFPSAYHNAHLFHFPILSQIVMFVLSFSNSPSVHLFNILKNMAPLWFLRCLLNCSIWLQERLIDVVMIIKTNDPLPPTLRTLPPKYILIRENKLPSKKKMSVWSATPIIPHILFVDRPDRSCSEAARMCQFLIRHLGDKKCQA